MQLFQIIPPCLNNCIVLRLGKRCTCDVGFFGHFGLVAERTPMVTALAGSISGSPVDVNYFCHTSITYDTYM